jgi:hypothetical protein
LEDNRLRGRRTCVDRDLRVESIGLNSSGVQYMEFTTVAELRFAVLAHA